MNPDPRVTFALDRFAVGSPGQQLLDRFLIGYNRDGTFHRPGLAVTLSAADLGNREWAERRVRDHRLTLAPTLESALAAPGGVIICPASPESPLVRAVVAQAPPGTRCFVLGLSASDGPSARALAELAAQRKIVLETGVAIEHAFRLPEMRTPPRALLRRALVLYAGDSPEAELEACHALFSLLRGGPGQGSQKMGSANLVRTVRALAGREVWAWTEANRDLFAAAVSRSNTIQGDPVRDGRTQDIAGLGLLEGLVTAPRGWELTHADGLRSALLILNGALSDLNCALDVKGEVLSAQFYCPPPPAQDHYSGLAWAAESFLGSTADAGGDSLALIPPVYAEFRRLAKNN